MSDPQRLITSCGDQIRILAGTERSLRMAILELWYHMYSLRNLVQEETLKQWDDVDKTNKVIQEESHKAALQLSMAIDMYITVQADVTSDNISDMVTELYALKKALNGYRLDQHELLQASISHATEICNQQCQAMQERVSAASQEIEASNAEVTTLQNQLEVLRAQNTAGLPGTNPSSKATTGAAASGIVLTDDQRSLEQHRTVLQKLAQAQEHQSTAQKIMKVFEGVHWTSTSSGMGSVVEIMKKEEEQMKALPELRMQLLNEISAYIAAFEGLQTFPGKERHAALNNMQSRVSSTAPAWRGISALLTSEYAKGKM